MLERRGVLHHARDVHPALVREGVLADVRLIGVGRAVEQLVEVVRRLGERREPVRRQARVAQLQLQVGDDRDEVRVAAALAIAVHRALHVRRARLDARERVGDAAARVVVAVDPDARAAGRERGGHRAGRLGDLAGQRAAVRVAEDDRLRPRLGGGAQAAQRVLRVVAPAVEAVLGVVDDALALREQERDRLLDHAQVLVAVDLHDLLDVQPPRLADERADGCEAVGEHAQGGVVLGARLAPARHAEGGDVGSEEVLACEQVEQLELLRVRAGEAGLDQVDAERVEPVRDAQLLLRRERHALPLHPIAEGGVVELDRRHAAYAAAFGEATGTKSFQAR